MGDLEEEVDFEDENPFDMNNTLSKKEQPSDQKPNVFFGDQQAAGKKGTAKFGSK